MRVKRFRCDRVYGDTIWSDSFDVTAVTIDHAVFDSAVGGLVRITSATDTTFLRPTSVKTDSIIALYVSGTASDTSLLRSRKDTTSILYGDTCLWKFGRTANATDTTVIRPSSVASDSIIAGNSSLTTKTFRMLDSALSNTARNIDVAGHRDSTNLPTIWGYVDTSYFGMPVHEGWYPCTLKIWTNYLKDATAIPEAPLHPDFYKIYTDAGYNTTGAYPGGLYFVAPIHTDGLINALEWPMFYFQSKRMLFDAVGWYSNPLDKYGCIKFMTGTSGDTTYLQLGGTPGGASYNKFLSTYTTVDFRSETDSDTILFWIEGSVESPGWYVHWDSSGVNKDTTAIKGGRIENKLSIVRTAADSTFIRPTSVKTDTIFVLFLGSPADSVDTVWAYRGHFKSIDLSDNIWVRNGATSDTMFYTDGGPDTNYVTNNGTYLYFGGDNHNATNKAWYTSDIYPAIDTAYYCGFTSNRIKQLWAKWIYTSDSIKADSFSTRLSYDTLRATFDPADSANSVYQIRNASLTVNGAIGNNTQRAITLGAGAATFAVSRNVITITGDAGGNNVTTITGAKVGLYTFIGVDALVTFIDDDSHAANTLDLTGNITMADDKVLTLVFDGNSWFEVGVSAN